MPLPDSAPAGAVELARFVHTLSTASSMQELERSFLAGFGRVIDVPMYGYDLFDPLTGTLSCAAKGHVSDAFVARYERDARAVDPMLARAYETGRPAYNRAFMSEEEWEASDVFRLAYRLHAVRHVVEIPMKCDGRFVGNLHFASSDPERAFKPAEIELAVALAAVVGSSIEGIAANADFELELKRANAALSLTGAPVVFSDPRSIRLHLNAAASMLLRDVAEAEERLHALLARPLDGGAFSRRIEVELLTGETATIHGQAAPLPQDHGGLIAVLALEREQPGIDRSRLTALTPREREVALLVVDGLADREIAERLHLSHHTVSQYVKRVYRKLAVDSRVALTRLLLGSHRP